jgi:hypothetical protein
MPAVAKLALVPPTPATPAAPPPASTATAFSRRRRRTLCRHSLLPGCIGSSVVVGLAIVAAIVLRLRTLDSTRFVLSRLSFLEVLRMRLSVSAAAPAAPAPAAPSPAMAIAFGRTRCFVGPRWRARFRCVGDGFGLDLLGLLLLRLRLAKTRFDRDRRGRRACHWHPLSGALKLEVTAHHRRRRLEGDAEIVRLLNARDLAAFLIERVDGHIRRRLDGEVSGWSTLTFLIERAKQPQRR